MSGSGLRESIESHLQDDETVLEYLVTNDSVWVCSDRRLFQHQQPGSGGSVPELSLDVVSDIERVETGGRPVFLVLAGLIAVVGFVSTQSIRPNVMGFWMAAGALPVALLFWHRSRGEVWEVKGAEIAGEDPEEWRIDPSEVEDDDLHAFVRTVRKQR